MEQKFDKIFLLKEILIAQINHLVFLPIITIVCAKLNYLNIFSFKYIMLYELFLFVPIVLYLARQYVNKTKYKALIHLALFVAPFIIPFVSMYFKVLMELLVVIYIIISWVYSDENNNTGFTINVGIAICICAISLFMVNKLNCPGHDYFFIVISIMQIAFAFVNYYLEQYFKFLSVNNSSASHIPAIEMLKSGSSLVFLYTGLSILIIFIISSYEWIRAILNTINDAMISILKKIVEFLNSLDRGTGIVESEEAQELFDSSLLGSDPIRTFWFWEVFEKLLVFVFLICVIVGFIYAIYKLYKLIRSKLGSNASTFSRLNESMVEVREKCEVREERFHLWNPFKPVSNSDKIRNLYKKKLLLNKDKIISSSSINQLDLVTAKEAGNILALNDFAAIYEKARYSNDTCSVQDLNRMKDECK